MDILWALLTLPYAPVRGLTAVVKVIQREAEAQRGNPMDIRRQLEELDRAAAEGELSRDELEQAQQAVLDRLGASSGGTAASATAAAGTAPGGTAPSGTSSGRTEQVGGAGRSGGTQRRREPAGPVRRRDRNTRGEGGDRGATGTTERQRRRR